MLPPLVAGAGRGIIGFDSLREMPDTGQQRGEMLEMWIPELKTGGSREKGYDSPLPFAYASKNRVPACVSKWVYVKLKSNQVYIWFKAGKTRWNTRSTCEREIPDQVDFGLGFCPLRTHYCLIGNSLQVIILFSTTMNSVNSAFTYEARIDGLLDSTHSILLEVR